MPAPVPSDLPLTPPAAFPPWRLPAAPTEASPLSTTRPRTEAAPAPERGRVLSERSSRQTLGEQAGAGGDSGRRSRLTR